MIIHISMKFLEEDGSSCRPGVDFVENNGRKKTHT